MTSDNSRLFRDKAALVGKTKDAVNDTNSSVRNTKINVPLKYLSNFWRSLEMPSINCRVHFELNWIEEFILSSARDFAKFKKIDTKLHVPIVTLSTKDNVNLAKQLSNGFEKSVYWNKYQTIPEKEINKEPTYMNYLVHHFKMYKIICSCICYCWKCCK